jgi:hypothetical protein
MQGLLVNGAETDYNPDEVKRYYMRLVFIEKVPHAQKATWPCGPFTNWSPERIEARLFIAFLTSGDLNS